jgi:hypothetical protein
MTTKSKQGSAHQRLQEFRAQAAEARVQARELQAQIDAAEHDAQRAAEAVVEGHADDDQEAVARARQAGDEAVALGHDLVARFAGATIRIQRADAAVDAQLTTHAKGLLEERAQEAERITADLISSVREVLRLHKALVNERTEQDRILAGSGANPRMDGPAPTYGQWRQPSPRSIV